MKNRLRVLKVRNTKLIADISGQYGGSGLERTTYNLLFVKLHYIWSAFLNNIHRYDKTR